MKTILEVLGESSVRAIIIASATACVLWGMKVKSPRICHRAWTGALMAMLCLPLFSIWAPRVAIRILPASSIPAARKPLSLAAERLQTVTSNLAGTGSAALGILPLPKRSTQPLTTNRPVRQMNVYQIAGILYLTGFCALAFRLLAGTLLSRRLVPGASRDGRVLYSPQCTVPMTVGLFRVQVILPMESKDWDPDKLDAVLTHEKEHMRRRDPLAEWIALLNRSLYWFNPLAWWLCRKMSALAEQACDEAVLVRGHDSNLYAGHLLEFARSVKQRGSLVTVWGSSLHGSTLGHRIRRILNSGVSPAISPARLVLVTSFLVVAAVVPLFFELSPVHAAPPTASVVGSSSGFEVPAPKMRPTQSTHGQVKIERPVSQDDRVPSPKDSLAPENAADGDRKLATAYNSNMPISPASAQQPSSSEVYVVGPDVKAPEILSQPLPAYTAEARAAGVEGIVLIQAIIRKDGTVDSFKILRGLGYGLDESAINTITTRWRFRPGTLNGEPVDVWANIEVSFRLFHDGDVAYGLRVQIVDTNWDQNASENKAGFGHGNLFDAASIFGFDYDCSCSQSFVPGNYPARWIEPRSRLVIVLGLDTSTGLPKVCELKVTMQDYIYSIRDGQVITLEPQKK
jgi:TonB family protein